MRRPPERLSSESLGFSRFGAKADHIPHIIRVVLEEGPPLGDCFEPFRDPRGIIFDHFGVPEEPFWEHEAPIMSKILQAGTYRKHMWPNVGIWSPPGGAKPTFVPFLGSHLESKLTILGTWGIFENEHLV